MAKAKTTEAGEPLDPEEVVATIFLDFIEDGEIDQLLSFLKHIEFDFSRVPKSADGAMLFQCFRAHYLRNGVPDHEPLLADFVRWPPMARAIEELEQKQARAKGRRGAKAA
jgi:hypothetical protein